MGISALPITGWRPVAAIDVQIDRGCHCWLIQQWSPQTSVTLLGKPAVAPALRECVAAKRPNVQSDRLLLVRMTTDSKPLLLVISQVYVPDPASVGQHMADAAECLAGRGYRVRVYTSARGYESPGIRYPRQEIRGGVEICRLPFSSFGKKTLVHRIVGQLLFLLQVIVKGIMCRRLAGILVSTSPPMASLAALVISWVRRVPITYWLMDLNPDQAIQLGKVAENGLLARGLRWLNALVFARAREVVALDRFMAERIRKQYRIRGRLETLPPWPHNDALEDVPAKANPFRREHNPDGRFVVMYSGNHSLASPVTTLVQAAVKLRDDSRFRFMFVGDGVGKREVDEAIKTERLTNVISLPYQPLERIRYSLSAADLHVVALGNDMVGIIHPCKIYGAMAVGRPVLLIGPRPSHAADLIDGQRVGWQIEHGDVAGAVSMLQKIVVLPLGELAAMGRRARGAVGERFSKRILCDALCDVIERSLEASRRAVAAPVEIARRRRLEVGAGIDRAM